MIHRRAMLGQVGAVALGAMLPWQRSQAAEPYDAVVSLTLRDDIKAPRFTSIASALAAAPADPHRPHRILIGKGVWRERLVIDKPFIRLIGEGRDESVIVFNRSAGDLGEDGKPIGTFKTQTVAVTAADFSAAHLTIANDFDYVAHLPPPVPTDKTGASGAQAIALSIHGGADRCSLKDVAITGHQDTLYTDSGRSRFEACRITGSVDFIFGAGRVWFENCEIVSRLRPGQALNGYIAAPDTDVHQPVGLVFSACRLVKEAGVAAHTVALGRPWRHTRTFADGMRYGDPDNVGACAYLNCWMDDHIVPEGWSAMGYTAQNGSKLQLEPEDVRFFEYASRGPGAGKFSAKRRFLTTPEEFTEKKVLQGWDR
ncbi:MAG: pectinesterase family protein [Rhizomicrobium sp.]